MVADGPDEELQALLSARRQRVDEQGEEYSSGAGGERRGADAKWSELDPAQFTPKSAYHRAHEALSAISEAAGAGEASGASGAGTPQAKAEAEAEAEAVAAASPRPALSPRPTPRRTPRQRPSQRRAAGAEGPPEPSPRRPPLQSPRDVAPMSARLARSGFDVTPLCSPRLDDQASPVGRHLQSPLDDQAAPVPPASADHSAGPSGSAVGARGAANFYAVFDAGEPDGAGKATPASPSVSVGRADAALPADVMELDMTLPIKLSELDMTLPIKAWTDGAGEGPALDAAPLAEVRRSQAAPAAARSDGDAAVWRAVVKGRLPKVQELAARGQLTSGRMQDHNGHSVFWNAVAFQQPEVALWLLRRFPPGPEPGVDLAEEHARRGDTLLHLCLYLTEFRGPAAEVFSAIFASPEVRRERANEGGQTFLHVAAARLNFWVLRLVLSRAPELVGLFCARDKHGLSPTDALMRRVGEVSGAVPDRPSVRALGPEAGLPSWCPLGSFRPRVRRTMGFEAPPPFADLMLEVEDASAEGGVARAAVHRVVVAVGSPRLHERIRALPAGATFRLDPLCCHSGEVLDAVVNFLYSGEVGDLQQDAFLLWQLVCLCTQYALPAPLAEHARTALVAVIDEPRHAPVAPVLMQAADKVGLTTEERGFVACAVLRCPAASAGTEGPPGGKSRPQALLAALAEAEALVFGPQPARPQAAQASAPAASPRALRAAAPAMASGQAAPRAQQHAASRGALLTAP